VPSRLRHPLLDERRRPDRLSRLAYYGRSIPRLLRELDAPHRTVGLFLGVTRPDGRAVRVRDRDLLFHVRSREDVWSIKETLLDGFYDRPGLRPTTGWSIVDVGGGIGDFAVDVAARDPTARVHVFEPDAAARRLAELNVAANGLANVTLHPEALAGRTGTVQLDETAADPLRRQAGTGTGTGGRAVPALDLGDALERAGIDDCDLLKLDCEGAEYEILAGAGKTLARVRRLVGEFHELGPGRDLRALATFLADSGYDARWTRSYVQPHTGYFWAVRQAHAP
jgi:FkbM family methyltransferase